MKKLFLFVVFVFISLTSTAQNTNESNKPYYFYCELSLIGKWGSDYKAYLEIDNTEQLVICDENNQPIIFKKTMPIFNMMSKAGWEFVESNTVGNYMHYIFKKQVTKDEEAKIGLNLLTSEEVKKAKK